MKMAMNSDGKGRGVRRAAIIGNGAIGTLLAAALEERGFQTSFVGRQGPLPWTARLILPSGEERLVCAKVADTAALRACELAFVAVKAFDLAAGLRQARALAPEAVLIPVANGFVEEEVRAAGGTRLGFVTFGVSALEPGRYALRAKEGEIAFGPLDGGAKSAAEAALTAHPGAVARFCWHESIIKLARRKWLFNVVINSLAATRRLPRNGDLLGDIPMLAAVFEEAWRLGAERLGPWAFAKDEAFQALEALLVATQDNENSMARDVRLGRPTESAYLAGLARDPARFPLLCGLHARLQGQDLKPRP